MDLEPETPTGGAAIWPIIVMIFAAGYIVFQLLRYLING